MGYIENLKAQTEQAMKAKAFDDMQTQKAMEQVYHQGNTDAYKLGQRDGAAELNALFQEGLAKQMADPRMYEAKAPYPQGQEMYQGAPLEQQGLAQRIAQ